MTVTPSHGAAYSISVRPWGRPMQRRTRTHGSEHLGRVAVRHYAGQIADSSVSDPMVSSRLSRRGNPWPVHAPVYALSPPPRLQARNLLRSGYCDGTGCRFRAGADPPAPPSAPRASQRHMGRTPRSNCSEGSADGLSRPRQGQMPSRRRRSRSHHSSSRKPVT